MALVQATEPTTTTQVAEVLDDSYISRLLETPAIDPLVGESIVRREVMGADVHSYTYEIVTRNQFTGAAIVTQNDAAPEESFDPTSATISGARRGLRGFVLDATRRTVISTANEVIFGLQLAVRDLIHRTILGLFTSISASAGNNATDNTLANWDVQTTAFRAALHDIGQLWAVLNPDGIRDLRTDLVTNAAALFGATWGDRAANALMNQTPGLGVPFDGFTIYESNDTPAGDTTGWTNAMGVIGGLDLLIWDPLVIEMQRDASRYGTWLVAGTIVGVGIRNQKNLRAFITRT